jgi:aryl-alcohol dehydrogenase-like predicted oxidoreductase
MVRDQDVCAYSPLLGGLYGGRTDRSVAGPYETPHNSQRLATLQTVSTRLGVTPNQLVLAWMLHLDPPVLPIVGTSSVAQLKENLAALDIRLTPQDMEELANGGNLPKQVK